MSDDERKARLEEILHRAAWHAVLRGVCNTQYAKDVGFLLSELERVERELSARTNADVKLSRERWAHDNNIRVLGEKLNGARAEADALRRERDAEAALMVKSESRISTLEHDLAAAQAREAKLREALRQTKECLEENEDPDTVAIGIVRAALAAKEGT